MDKNIHLPPEHLDLSDGAAGLCSGSSSHPALIRPRASLFLENLPPTGSCCAFRNERVCLLIPAHRRLCMGPLPASPCMFALGCVVGRDVHPDVTEDSVGPNTPDLLPVCSRTAGTHHFQRKTSQTGTAERLLSHFCCFHATNS